MVLTITRHAGQVFVQLVMEIDQSPLLHGLNRTSRLENLLDVVTIFLSSWKVFVVTNVNEVF